MPVCPLSRGGDPCRISLNSRSGLSAANRTVSPSGTPALGLNVPLISSSGMACPECKSAGRDAGGAATTFALSRATVNLAELQFN